MNRREHPILATSSSIVWKSHKNRYTFLILKESRSISFSPTMPNLSPNNRILLNHFPLPIDRKPSLSGLQDYPTKMATRSLPGSFGSLQGFFEGMAVVGGHIRKGRWGYGQTSVHMKKSRTPPCDVLLLNNKNHSRLFLDGLNTGGILSPTSCLFISVNAC